jgi:hypothetical protein
MQEPKFYYKQLEKAHGELRKLKKFLKCTSQNFLSFNSNIKKSFKFFKGGNLFNEIHYHSFMSVQILEFFNNEVICILTIGFSAPEPSITII